MCRKQLPITYSTYMEQCAFSLQEDSEVDTDKTLIHFIKLLRIMNEIYSVFEYGDPDHSLSLGDDKVQMVVKALEGQLHSWRESLPPDMSQHGGSSFPLRSKIAGKGKLTWSYKRNLIRGVTW